MIELSTSAEPRTRQRPAAGLVIGRFESPELLAALRRVSRGGSALFIWLALIKLGLLAGGALSASVLALVH